MVKDHLGNEYLTRTAMALAYGLTHDTVRGRLSRKADLKTALTTPVKEKHSGKCKDHLGNEFPSKKARANNYGVRTKLVDERLARGFSLENALTYKRDNHGQEVFDHNDTAYPNMDAMLAAYNVSWTTYEGRLASGATKEDALTKRRIKTVEHIGEERITVAGQKMKIVAYRSRKDIDIQFEDETIREHVNYRIFSKGEISNLKLDTGGRYVQVAYKLDDGTVALYCRCRKCKKQYIGTWRDVYEHVCENYEVKH